jgi:hypothetical protein
VLWLRKSEEATGALSGCQIDKRKSGRVDAHATSGPLLLLLLLFLLQLVFLTVGGTEQGK